MNNNKTKKCLSFVAQSAEKRDDVSKIPLEKFDRVPVPFFFRIEQLSFF